MSLTMMNMEVDSTEASHSMIVEEPKDSLDHIANARGCSRMLVGENDNGMATAMMDLFATENAVVRRREVVIMVDPQGAAYVTCVLWIHNAGFDSTSTEIDNGTELENQTIFASTNINIGRTSFCCPQIDVFAKDTFASNRILAKPALRLHQLMVSQFASKGGKRDKGRMLESSIRSHDTKNLLKEDLFKKIIPTTLKDSKLHLNAIRPSAASLMKQWQAMQSISARFMLYAYLSKLSIMFGKKGLLGKKAYVGNGAIDKSMRKKRKRDTQVTSSSILNRKKVLPSDRALVHNGKSAKAARVGFGFVNAKKRRTASGWDMSSPHKRHCSGARPSLPPSSSSIAVHAKRRSIFSQTQNALQPTKRPRQWFHSHAETIPIAAE